MELPVLITLEEDKFDSIYAFFSNPTVMFAVVLAVAAVTLFILWLISRRESNRKNAAIQEQFKVIVKEEAPAESPEVKRLKERETKIRDIESSLKSRKRSDLESREKMLLEKQMMEGVAGPRSEPAGKPTPPRQPLDYAAVEPRGTPQEYESYVGGITPAAESASELERERKKLKKMIDLASEKYNRGEMDKETFMRIETDYYKKLIDLEVEMRGDGDAKT